MSIRNKTKRRLSILLACIVFVIGTGLGIYFIRMNQREREAAEHRELAIAAAQEHRYADAVDHFRPAMRYYHEDPEALYWLAHARREVPLPNAKHLEEAVSYLDRALKFRPDYKQAQHDLLQLYVGIRRDTEALALAERVLAQDPSDYEAIRAKIIALSRLRKLEDSMAVVEKALADHPDEYRYYLLALEVMEQQDRRAQEIIALGAKALEEHPDDPRFQLVMAFAYGLAQEGPKALELATRLTEVPAMDAEYLTKLVEILDGMSKYDLSIKALRLGAKRVESPRLYQMMLRRLWEYGRHEELLKELADVDPASAKTGSEALAIKALALSRAGKKAEAQKLIAALEERRNDLQAVAWTAVLKHSTDDQPQSAAEVLAMLRTAIVQDPTNPYLLYARGDTYARLGENESAIESWEQITGTGRFRGVSPTWYLPYVRLAQTYIAIGRHEDAIRAAESGRRRAPQDSGVAALTYIEVNYEALNAGLGNDRALQQMLEQIATVQKEVPNEPQTLPIYVDLLARAGQRENADEAFRAGLADPQTRFTESILLRLASISRKHGLGLETQAFARSEKDHGLTPNLALSQAEAIHATGGAEPARRYMQSVLDKVGEKGSELGWRMVWARLLDVINDPLARELWTQLVKDNPNHLGVQRSALETQCLRDDRKLLDGAIARLRAITGDEGLTWRLAQAKLSLAQGASDADLLRASNVLKQIVRESPNLIEPRLLLADAQRRLGITAEAIDQLNQVAAMQPSNLGVMLNVAQLRMEQGDFAGARTQLARLAPDELTADQAAQAALIHLGLGDNSDAVASLEPIHRANPADARAGLLLAQAYLRLNDLAKAEATLQAAMAQPSAPVILAYAKLLAGTSRYDQAVTTLAKLDEVVATPYDRQMLLAEFHRSQIDKSGADKAAEHLRAAVQAQPQDPAAHRALIAHYAELGRIDDALAANAAAQKAIPADPGFALIQREAELVRYGAGDPLLRGLIEVVVSGGRYHEPAVEVMRLVRDAQGGKEDQQSATRKLRQLTDRASRSVALQNVMIDWYTSRGDHTQAVELAVQTSHAFPMEASPAQRAARLLTDLRRWDQVVAMADEWRRRSPSQAQAADLAAAQALINLGQPRPALQRIEPYVAAALADPSGSAAVVSLYTTALVADRKPGEAAKVLEPLLPESPEWRVFWAKLAASAVRDLKAAAQWIEQVAALMPADAQSERIELAQAWASLADRSREPAHRGRAIDVLRPLADKPDADASTLFTYGLLLYQQAMQMAADPAKVPESRELLRVTESAYRRCIERAPEHWSSMNNLAMLLAETGGSLDEAAALARKAIQLQPEIASLHDTCAFVEMNRKRYDDAARSWQKAVELEPANPEWRVNLAYALLEKGDRDRVDELIRQLDESRDGDRLTPASRERLDQLRRSVTEPQAAAR